MAEQSGGGVVHPGKYRRRTRPDPYGRQQGGAYTDTRKDLPPTFPDDGRDRRGGLNVVDLPDLVTMQRESFLRFIQYGMPNEMRRLLNYNISYTARDERISPRQEAEQKYSWRTTSIKERAPDAEHGGANEADHPFIDPMANVPPPQTLNERDLGLGLVVHEVLHPLHFKFERPTLTAEECLVEGRTYSARVWAPVSVSVRPKRDADENVESSAEDAWREALVHYYASYPSAPPPPATGANGEAQVPKEIHRMGWVHMADVPLLTDTGHFVINGINKVVVSQIVRAPGVYFTEELDYAHGNLPYRTFTATIITSYGVWMRVEFDKFGRLFMKLDKSTKVNLIVLLQAMGMPLSRILAGFRHPEFVRRNCMAPDLRGKPAHPGTQEEAIKELMALLSKKRRSLAMINTSNTQAVSQIVSADAATIEMGMREIYTRFLDPMRYELGREGRIALNAKLNLSIPLEFGYVTPEDLLAIGDRLVQMFYHKETPLDDIDHLQNRRVRSVGEYMTEALRRGTNNVAEYCKRKARSGRSGKKPDPFRWDHRVWTNALSSVTGGIFAQLMDQSNPLAEVTHKRRITQMGPGGISGDRVSMEIRDVHPSHFGRICFIETPEGWNAGLVMSLTAFARVGSGGLIESPFHLCRDGYIDTRMRPRFLTAMQEYYLFASLGDYLASPEGKIPTVTKTQELTYRHQGDYKFARNNSKLNITPVSSCSFMSVATACIPFLEHDDCNRALMGSNMQRQSVTLLNPERPIVGTGFEPIVVADTGSSVRAQEAGVVTKSHADEIVVRYSGEVDGKPALRRYPLKRYFQTNQNTTGRQRPVVRRGQLVQAGDLLADGISCVKGDLSLGTNVRVAYIPWSGYNYEDSIIVSNRMLDEDRFTSMHVKKYSTSVEDHMLKDGSELSETLTRELPGYSPSELCHLDERGIVRVGSVVFDKMVLVGKTVPRDSTELPPEVALLQAILGEEAKQVRDVSLRLPWGIKGRVVDVKVHTDMETPPVRRGKQATSAPREPRISSVQVKVMIQRRLRIGDKLAGRHGNKGVVSKIVPPCDMPHLPDGQPVDIILNPLGVPSRMNVGQLYEALLGLAGYYMDESYRLAPFQSKWGYRATEKLVYTKLHDAAKRTGHRWLFHPEHPGKFPLTDGRTGRVFDQPVLAGVSHFLKLYHMVEEKFHVRSTGSYSFILNQPMGGRKSKGGQRVGEMEIWALQGYGAAHILQELLTVKADDIKQRQMMQLSIVRTGLVPKGNVSEGFKAIVSYMKALCLDVEMFEGKMARGDLNRVDLRYK